MTVSHSVRLLAGSIAVYLAVATIHACGSSGPATGSASSGGAGGSGGSNGASMGGAGAKDGVGGSQASSATHGGASGADGASSTGSIMDPVGDAHANESGSRLKAKWYKGADGAKQWIGWYDSQRQEDCNILTATDGTLRCMPGFAGVASPGSFADAMCTQEIAAIGAPCSPSSSKYVLRYVPPASGCGVYSYGWHATGAEIIGVTTIYIKTSTSCVAQKVTSPTKFYQIGAEISPSEFVEASTVIE